MTPLRKRHTPCLVCGAPAGEICQTSDGVPLHLLAHQVPDLETVSRPLTVAEQAIYADVLRDLREHAQALDENWSATHEAAMGAIREALHLPEATVPEMVTAIINQSWAIGSEREDDCHTAWRQGYDAASVGISRDRNPHLSPNADPPPDLLHVYTDDVYLMIAHSPEDAMKVVVEADMGEYDESFPDRLYRIEDHTVISIKIWTSGPHAGKIAHGDQVGADIVPLIMPALDWIRREGRGFLCSTEG